MDGGRKGKKENSEYRAKNLSGRRTVYQSAVFDYESCGFGMYRWFLDFEESLFCCGRFACRAVGRLATYRCGDNLNSLGNFVVYTGRVYYRSGIFYSFSGGKSHSAIC